MARRPACDDANQSNAESIDETTPCSVGISAARLPGDKRAAPQSSRVACPDGISRNLIRSFTESDPMALSYTQILEDYHLWVALQGKQSGFYIDVGGGHPIADNVSFWFYERGWRGIVVEPPPRLAEMYGFVRPRDTTVPTLVGKHEGEADFYQSTGCRRWSRNSRRAERSTATAMRWCGGRLRRWPALQRPRGRRDRLSQNRCRGSRRRCSCRQRLVTLSSKSHCRGSNRARNGAAVMGSLGTIPARKRI